MRNTVAIIASGDLSDAARVKAAADLLRWVPPGNAQNVVFKPNLIKEQHLLKPEFEQVITQPGIIAGALELFRERPPQRMLVADAPEGSANLELLLQRSGISDLSAGLRQAGRDLQVADLRLSRYDHVDGVPTARIALAGDPAGSVRVNLGAMSRFYGVEGRRYYGADFDVDETNRHHNGATQEYMFSGSVLGADLLVNIPKMKTHKKAGVTLSLKNLVGANANKNWLPHHSLGSPSTGGDAYPDATRATLEGRLLNWLKPLAHRSRLVTSLFVMGKKIGRPIFGDTQSVIRSGNWWGNDTLWRMIHDLNRILLYARPDGSVAETRQRETVSIVDGVVAGEGNGPEAPDRLDAGIVAMGESFAAVDLVCAKLMGFDWQRIPQLAHLFDEHQLPLVDFAYDQIDVVSDFAPWNRPLISIDPASCRQFRPHFGWSGHIELSR